MGTPQSSHAFLLRQAVLFSILLAHCCTWRLSQWRERTACDPPLGTRLCELGWEATWQTGFPLSLSYGWGGQACVQVNCGNGESLGAWLQVHGE